MALEFSSLLYYCKARLFSPVKVSNVFVLEEEIAIFITDDKKNEAKLFYDKNFFVELVC